MSGMLPGHLEHAFLPRKACFMSTVSPRAWGRNCHASSSRLQVGPQCTSIHANDDLGNKTPNRRLVLNTAVGLLPLTTQMTAYAEEEEGSNRRGYARYIKKKKLDPLETYVPSVLQARLQLETAGRVMKQDVEGARTLLRKGAFSGLRDCVKALGEFATQAGTPPADASKLVNDFLGSLQSFDIILARAARDKTAAPATADKEFSQTLQNLDRLLATIPAAELNKGQELLDKVQAALAEPSGPPDMPGSDKAVKALEQLVPSR